MITKQTINPAIISPKKFNHVTSSTINNKTLYRLRQRLRKLILLNLQIKAKHTEILNSFFIPKKNDIYTPVGPSLLPTTLANFT